MRCRSCNGRIDDTPRRGKGVPLVVCPECGYSQRVGSEPLREGLPWGGGVEVAAALADEGRRLPRRGRVLVADPSEASRKLVSEILEARGFAVEAAGDGESALRAVARSDYDLLILELNLPLCDGFSVLEALREADAGGRSLPVLVTSSRDLRVEEYRALRILGAAGYLERARLEEEMPERVEELLAGHQVAAIA